MKLMIVSLEHKERKVNIPEFLDDCVNNIVFFLNKEMKHKTVFFWYN